ncbi:hypothetical protein [Piscirickettsia salmonis]|uniref:hypothetical protein n=1 Tax=Piscirickettsia salmonis TaxID=1238 RepID=UPI0007C8C495
MEAVKLILYKEHIKGDEVLLPQDIYRCSAELYVDKSLSLYWPGSYSKVDKVGDSGLQKAQVSTVQLKRKGEYWVPGPYASMLYDSYDQTIKPGLAKINLSFFGCNYS